MEGTFKRLLGNCKSGINTLKQLEGSFEIIADKKTDKRVVSLPKAPPPPAAVPRAGLSSSTAQGPGLGQGVGLSSSSILRSQSASHPPRDPTFISELGAGGTVMGVDTGGGSINLSRSSLHTPNTSSNPNSTSGQLRFKIPTRAAKELLSDADQTVADAVLASSARTRSANTNSNSNTNLNMGEFNF